MLFLRNGMKLFHLPPFATTAVATPTISDTFNNDCFPIVLTRRSQSQGLEAHSRKIRVKEFLESEVGGGY